jgi:LacI family transcriptional regulator
MSRIVSPLSFVLSFALCPLSFPLPLPPPPPPSILSGPILTAVNAPPKVALLVETSNSYARGLLRGVVSYIRERGPWSLCLSEHNRGDKPPAWLSRWDGQGIIARIETPAIAAALRGVKVPVVDMSAARLIPALPWFETDDGAIAHLAAEHLLERGFKHFAYCGESRFNWSNWRCEHFLNSVRAAGHACAVYKPAKPYPPDDENETAELARWVSSLPKPVGIMACYDLRGQQLLDACRRSGTAVPDEAAVIGVDNDDLLCELSDPPLSSVVPNTHRTGYEAAQLLDKMMNGARIVSQTHLIPPLGIATRQSTDVLAIDDRNVARAVHYIRQNACKGITVQDVLKAVPQSRRLLESRFHKLIGRTPHAEILRVKLNRVKQLLTETDLPLDQIAERSGFTHVEYLTVAFKREVGVPPSRFRAVNKP